MRRANIYPARRAQRVVARRTASGGSRDTDRSVFACEPSSGPRDGAAAADPGPAG